MVLAASITDQAVTFAAHVVREVGLPGVFVLMLAESACVPIPSEATMLFAGFSVAAGHHWSIWQITVVGVAGNLAGSWLAYAVGYFGRLGLVERRPGRIGLNPRHVAWADRWFARYGQPAVFFSRLLPIVRTFISLPAGVGRMPFWRFSALTLAGCVPWVLGLALAGRALGTHWMDYRGSFGYVDDVVLALVAAAALVLIARWVLRRVGGRPLGPKVGEG